VFGTLAICTVEPLLVLLPEPHIAACVQVLVYLIEAIHILDNGVVDEVHVRVSILARGVILLTCKTDIRLLPDIEGERIPIHNQYPLPDVKLVAMDQLRLLNVFLADPLETITLRDSKYFV